MLPGPGEVRRRLSRLLAGLVVLGTGVALMVRAGLGLSPWDVLHEGLSERTGLSFGVVVVAVGAAVLALWVPLRQRVGVGTVANALAVGAVIDLVLGVLPTARSALLGWAFLATGLVGMAVGSGLYIGAGLGTGPRDGLMTGLAARGASIRLVRTTIELSALLVGWLLGGTVGIGTVVGAIAIGPLVQLSLTWFALPPPTSWQERKGGGVSTGTGRP